MPALHCFCSRPPRPSHSLTLYSALTLSLPLTTLPKLLIATAGIRLVCRRRPRRAAGESNQATPRSPTFLGIVCSRSASTLFVLKSQVVCLVAGQMLDTDRRHFSRFARYYSPPTLSAACPLRSPVLALHSKRSKLIFLPLRRRVASRRVASVGG